MTGIDCHLIYRAKTGIADECGDIGVIRKTPDYCWLSLVDVLGHGKSAYQIACRARAWLENQPGRLPVEMIGGLHDCLKGTRGAVAAVCRLAIETGELIYAGMGNITLRIFGARPGRLVTRDGVLGYKIPAPLEKTIRLHAGDILVMSSDGVREHFEPLDYPDLFMGGAEQICRRFIRELSKPDDDASCIVLRYNND